MVIPSPQIGFPPSLSGSAEQLFTVTFAGTKPLMMFVWSLGLRGSVASGEVSRSAVVSTIHWKLVRANTFIFIRTRNTLSKPLTGGVSLKRPCLIIPRGLKNKNSYIYNVKMKV